MRKLSLFFALLFVFLLASSAFAGPFSDVPANSWAYKAVQDLAAKGLVIGYGDSTFRGDRLATRYEMAMVVARMLDMYEKGQNAQDQKIELNANDIATLMKLAEEFKSELASLNVRVAALEKKAALDTVNFTGDARFRLAYRKQTFYALDEPYKVVSLGFTTQNLPGTTINGSYFMPVVNGLYPNGAQTTKPLDKEDTFMRYYIRLNVNAPVADNISYTARLAMEKNAGVNGTGDLSSPFGNPKTGAITSGYNDNDNRLFVERSFITWNLNPYPVTFLLGRLPTMVDGQYFNKFFLDSETEGAIVRFDLNNFLPDSSLSFAWVKFFDDGLITAENETYGLKDRDAYIASFKSKIFNAIGLEADYGTMPKFTYFSNYNSNPTAASNPQYGKYNWWTIQSDFNVYGVNFWAGYEGTSVDMPAGVTNASNYTYTGMNSVNGGAFRIGALYKLPVGYLWGDFYFANNKWYNPVAFFYSSSDTSWKDFYQVWYILPIAKNATLKFNYEYWKGKKPYNTDAANQIYYTFNPMQLDTDQRYYIQMDVSF
ncbi:DUF3373 family protein [Thermodesulfobium sp.]